MITVAAHQPNFLYALVNIHKMIHCDIWVIRDDVQWVKNDFHHRQRILSESKQNNYNQWLTLPVDKRQTIFSEKKILNQTKIKKNGHPGNMAFWFQDHLETITAQYGGKKARFFQQYFPEIEEIYKFFYDKYGKEEEAPLLKLNMEFIHYMMKVFDIKREIIMASELKIDYNDPTGDLVQIVRKLERDKRMIYLSGIGGVGYLKNEVFEKNGIELKYQEFQHPKYKQNSPYFIPNLGFIDALFHEGRNITSRLK